ncbi:hypothetical protein B7463_g4958, partial [Scytalidium lignicola]
MDTYYLGMLRDTGSATFLPSVNSTKHQEGFVYSQFYFKGYRATVSSAVGIFANEKLEMLALDPEFVASVQQDVRKSVKNSKAIIAAYLQTKNQAYHNLKNARQISYGAREEHRISGELWEQVIAGLCHSMADPESPGETAPQLPYYTIPSNDLFGFLYGQINKFCLGFEFVLACMDPGYTRWEETQAATIFLRALRYLFGAGPVYRSSLLWRGQWIKNGQLYQGLNIGMFMSRTGLSWFDSIFDWTTWTPKPLYTNLILQGNPQLLQHYHLQHDTMQNKKDVFLHLQQVSTWLTRCCNSPQAIQVILDYVTGLCLAQFRIDVYNRLVKDGDIKNEHVKAAITGQLPLCSQTLANIQKDPQPLWFVTNHRTEISDPFQLVELEDAGPGLWQIWDLARRFRPDPPEFLPVFTAGGHRKANLDVEQSLPPATYFNCHWIGLKCKELELLIGPLLGNTDTEGQEERRQQLPVHPMNITGISSPNKIMIII